MVILAFTSMVLAFKAAARRVLRGAWRAIAALAVVGALVIALRAALVCRVQQQGSVRKRSFVARSNSTS
jgi:hypothetical protein